MVPKLVGSAWTLNVWGFHEAKLNSEAVRYRLPHGEDRGRSR